MEKIHPYYQKQERKNMELVDCWGKAMWYGLLICLVVHWLICVLEH